MWFVITEWEHETYITSWKITEFCICKSHGNRTLAVSNMENLWTQSRGTCTACFLLISLISSNCPCPVSIVVGCLWFLSTLVQRSDMTCCELCLHTPCGLCSRTKVQRWLLLEKGRECHSMKCFPARDHLKQFYVCDTFLVCKPSICKFWPAHTTKLLLPYYPWLEVKWHVRINKVSKVPLSVYCASGAFWHIHWLSYFSMYVDLLWSSLKFTINITTLLSHFFSLFCSDDFAGHGNSYHGLGGRGNKRAQMRYCLHLMRSMVSLRDSSVNQDLTDQGAINQILGEFSLLFFCFFVLLFYFEDEEEKKRGCGGGFLFILHRISSFYCMELPDKMIQHTWYHIGIMWVWLPSG